MQVKDSLFLAAQRLLPHHLVSRLVGLGAASRAPWLKNRIIRRFVEHYRVDMSQAAQPDPLAYDSFNAFFTRALRPGARPLAPEADAVLCPADGVISQIGAITQGRILQAKGHDYSLTALLGGDARRAAPFEGGAFATVYLSPRDYHRVHMPATGTLREMLHVPGRLFSVNALTASHVPGLFARNERRVCIFDTPAFGPMAVVLVGAMIVASIETVCEPGQLLPRGEELGRFLLGSTAIVLFGPNAVQWRRDMEAGSAVRMGQALGAGANRAST